MPKVEVEGYVVRSDGQEVEGPQRMTWVRDREGEVAIPEFETERSGYYCVKVEAGEGCRVLVNGSPADPGGYDAPRRVEDWERPQQRSFARGAATLQGWVLDPLPPGETGEGERVDRPHFLSFCSAPGETAVVTRTDRKGRYRPVSLPEGTYAVKIDGQPARESPYEAAANPIAQRRDFTKP